MADSKFWRIVAIMTVMTLLYVGHGLHNRGGDGLPPFGNLAHAAGVGVATVRGSVLYTSSEDGRTVYMWNTEPTGKPTFVTSAQVK